jgi:hypothetical protein
MVITGSQEGAKYQASSVGYLKSIAHLSYISITLYEYLEVIKMIMSFCYSHGWYGCVKYTNILIETQINQTQNMDMIPSALRNMGQWGWQC